MAWEGPPPPYRIETDRLVIRCYDPGDAPLLKDAIDSSLDHLRPFMPWTDDEPQSLEEKVALLRRFRAAFDAGDNFVYGIFDPEERELLGGTGLHPRIGPEGLEVGYWTRTSRTRQGIATEASAAMTRVAFEICGADRVEIRIEPTNAASLAVPPKLGFPEEARLRRRLPARPGEPLRDVVVFTLFSEAYEGSPAAGTQLRAWDAAGSELLG
jgi:RimJ/RimL family protein N-acetyltransferase